MKITFNIQYLLLGIFVVSILTLTCCDSKESRDILKKGDGEDFFRAIFFLQGELGSEMPHYNDFYKKTYKSSNSISIENSINSLINSIDSSFFEEFYSGLLSKDHIKIKNIIDVGGLEISEHLEKSIGIKYDDLPESIKKIDFKEMTTLEEYNKLIEVIETDLITFNNINQPDDPNIGFFLWNRIAITRDRVLTKHIIDGSGYEDILSNKIIDELIKIL